MRREWRADSVQGSIQSNGVFFLVYLHLIFRTQERFADFSTSLPISVGMVDVAKGNIAEGLTQPLINISSLMTCVQLQEPSIDDAQGAVQVWRVEEFEKHLITDPSQHGIFYSGESYVVLYAYRSRGREQYVVYFWQGRHSSISERGASALLSIELAKATDGVSIQRRIVQGKETRHFRAIFRTNGLIVRRGKTRDQGRLKTCFQLRMRSEDQADALESAIERELPLKCQVFVTRFSIRCIVAPGSLRGLY